MTMTIASARPRAALPRVLCVDDEPLVLAALSDNLRRRFEVVTAEGGAAGLRALAEAGPFSVIVSDFQMPVMNGAEFLARARTMMPDATRILLTGHASLEGAIDVVNRGQVFRFLLKPCPPVTLIRALEDAVEQTRLVTADRLLLERKLEEMSGHLLQAERLATLGTLACAVGHELNNMLTVFTTTHEFVLERARQGLPPLEEDLEALQHVRDHLTTHARSLLDLGRPGEEGRGECDLGRLLDAAVAMLRSAGLLRSVHVKVDYPSGEPVRIAMSRTRAEQVIVNLVKNAVDAMAGAAVRAGELTLGVVVDPERRMATCRVEDNGSGIPASALASIFCAYYTTKPRDRGTGLGLFVVKQIIESCGGDIGVESVEGRGTTFTLHLPLVTSS